MQPGQRLHTTLWTSPGIKEQSDLCSEESLSAYSWKLNSICPLGTITDIPHRIFAWIRMTKAHTLISSKPTLQLQTKTSTKTLSSRPFLECFLGLYKVPSQSLCLFHEQKRSITAENQKLETRMPSVCFSNVCVCMCMYVCMCAYMF